jgi:DNA-binding NtrC family response regulator
VIESPTSGGARSDAQRRGVVIESPTSGGARSDAQRRGVVIDIRQLPPELLLAPPPVPAPAVPGASLADLERYAILATLAANRGSTSKTARQLGLSVRTIQYRLHAYHPRSRASDGTARHPPPAAHTTRR